MSGRSRSEPFWERTYGETDADTFGPPAEEVLALIPRLSAGASVLDLGVKEVTRRGGWNVHAVFTDRLPQPPDLAPLVLCPFPQGALTKAYEDWAIELAESYILEDEHPGGIRHCHAIDEIVARRP